MAEVNNGDEPLLPLKRSPDLSTQEEPKVPKKHKLEDSNGAEAPQPQKTSRKDDCVQKPKDKAEFVDEEKRKEEVQQEEQQEAAEEEDNSNGEAVIDRKGKGILIEEEDEEEGDDDDDDSGSDTDSNIGDNLSDDSDFADDPLAEVDLDNILPSRTRRKSIQPGAYIANDLPDEDSDSDDPDA